MTLKKLLALALLAPAIVFGQQQIPPNTVPGNAAATPKAPKPIPMTGTGNVVMSNSPALVTPNLGQPSYLDLTNAVNAPLSTLAPVQPFCILGNNTGSTASPLCNTSFSIGSITTGAPGNVTINSGGGVFPTSNEFPVFAYGQTGIGTTPCTFNSTGDIGPCEQQAYNACAAAGGGRIIYPSSLLVSGGYFGQKTATIYTGTAPCAAEGVGVGLWGASLSQPIAGTVIKWTGGVTHNTCAQGGLPGSGSGPCAMIYIGQPTTGSSYSVGSVGIERDCGGLIDVGFTFQQIQSSTVKAFAKNCLEAGGWITTNTGANLVGSQDNMFWLYYYDNDGGTCNGHTCLPACWIIDGANTAAAGAGNVSLDTFPKLGCYQSGDGFVFGSVDNIDIWDVSTFPQSGNGFPMKIANPSFVQTCTGTFYGCVPLSGQIAGRTPHDSEITVRHAHVAVSVDGLQDGSTFTAGGSNVSAISTISGINTQSNCAVTGNPAACAETNSLTFASYSSTGSGGPTAPVVGMAGNCGASATASSVPANDPLSAVSGTTVTFWNQFGGNGTTAGAVPNSINCTFGPSWAPGAQFKYYSPAGSTVNSLSPYIILYTTATGTAMQYTTFTGTGTNGTYTNVSTSGGTGTGATVDVTVSGGNVINAVAHAVGSGYLVNDVLSFTITGGSGTAKVRAICGSAGWCLGAPVGGTSQAGISASGSIVTFTDLIFPYSGTPTTGDIWYAQPSQPQAGIAVWGVDANNARPLASFEAGAQGVTAYTAQAFPVVANPSLLNTNQTAVAQEVIQYRQTSPTVNTLNIAQQGAAPYTAINMNNGVGSTATTNVGSGGVTNSFNVSGPINLNTTTTNNVNIGQGGGVVQTIDLEGAVKLNAGATTTNLITIGNSAAPNTTTINSSLVKLNANTELGTTVPTIGAGWGSTAAYTYTFNTSKSFAITVGGTGITTTPSLTTFATAPNAWICTAQDTTTAITARQTTRATNSVQFTWSSAPTAADVIVFQCDAI